MKHTCKRITALLLILLLTGSLLASCSGREVESEELIPRILDLPLEEGEVVLDILEADENYRVLVGMPDEALSPSPYIMGEYVDETGKTYGYYSYQSQIRSYGNNLTERKGKREKTGDQRLQNALVVGDSLFAYAFGEYAYPGGDPESSPYAGRYDLYRDGELLCRLDQDVYENTVFQTVVDGETVYTLIRGASEELTHLYINHREVNLPPTYGAGGIESSVQGLVRFGEKVYVVLKQVVYNRAVTPPVFVKAGGMLVEIDANTKQVGKEGIFFSGKPDGTCAALGESIYYMEGTALYATDGKTSRYLCDLGVCGISSLHRAKRILPLSDGRIFVVMEDKLVECAPGGRGDKQVITLGTCKLEYEDGMIRRYVAAFNKQSKDYAVSIREFEEITDLNLALANGEIALVCSPDQMAMRHYARNGILLPLEEGVPEILEEGILLPNIMEAASIGGRHYFLPHEFEVQGYTLPESVMQGRTGFETVEEFLDFVEEHAATGLAGTTENQMFSLFLENVEDWVDWETHTADFVSGDYERILEFCKDNCSKNVEEAIASNEANASNSGARMRVSERVAEGGIISVIESGWDDDRVVLFPMPAETHDGLAICVPWVMGMVAQAEYQEGAAVFMRFLFLDSERKIEKNDYGTCKEIGGELVLVRGFPVNRAECESYIESHYELILRLLDEDESYGYLEEQLPDYRRNIEREQNHLNKHR